MKPILFFFLFLLIPKPVFSQTSSDDKIILLDSSFVETNTENYAYVRKIINYKVKQDIYIFNDYYKSGSILMKGTSSSNDKLTKEGQCVFYHENGNKKSVVNFIKNQPADKEFRWYENGNQKQEGEYIQDDNKDEKKRKSKYKVNQFWNIDGVQKVTDGNGEYEESEEKYFGAGSVKDGLKDGVWKGWSENPNIKFTESYKEGQFITGKSVDENNIETIYNVLLKKPEPKGGIMEFYKYIGKNYKSPKVEGLSGKIYVTFVVDTDGSIINPRVLRDIGYGTGIEALRVLKDYKDFNPGEQRGRKVKVLYSLPITIQTSKPRSQNNY